MSLALNKILVANVPTNNAGSYLLTTVVSSIGSGTGTAMSNAQYIPAGAYILPQTTNNVTIEVNAYTGSANAWTTYVAANTGGTIISDGFNVRANATTGTQTLTLYTANGGNAATGTYNS